MMVADRFGAAGVSATGAGAAETAGSRIAPMLPVGSGSRKKAGSNFAAAPLSGNDTKLQGITSSDSRAASRASSSRGGASGAARDGRSRTQVPSRGDGNGFDSASGTATKKTRTPHKLPPTTIAE